MSINETPSGERLHIGIFGRRNAGKSSLINAITGQDLAIVSDVKGTTTDPVKKAMELLPLGPVVLIDTPGLDDEGLLGQKRMEKALQALRQTDIVILTIPADAALDGLEKTLIQEAKKRGLSFFVVLNKTDLLADKKQIEEKKEMNCCEPICRGKLLLRRYHNRGAFLNLGEKNPQLVAAISVGMTVLAGLFFLSTFSFLGKGMLRWGLTMLLGGAFSNTYDRLKRKYVVDYVSFNVPWEAFRKIVFNIGDFAIMIGALVSVLSEV